MKSLRTGVALALLSGFAAGAVAAPLGTAWTYQGRLTDNGNPAQGAYDFQFRLFDAAGGGAQVGGTVLGNDLAVTGGLFMATLDFGSAAFDGNARWLEIGIRPGASVGAYTLLPRQALNIAPYALYSANGGLWQASGNAIQNTNTGFVGIGRATQVTGAEYFGLQAPGNGFGGMYIQTDGAGGQPFYGYAAGGNTAWTEWSGSTRKWQLYNAGYRLTATHTGEVGVGESTPLARLHVQGSSQLLQAGALLNDDVVIEDSDAVLGIYSDEGGSYGSALVLGQVSNTGAILDKWSLVRETTSAGNELRVTFGTSADYSANSAVMTYSDNGNVGIGTVSPTSRLHIFNTSNTSVANFAQLGTSGGGVNITLTSGTNPNSALSITQVNSTIPALQVGGTARVDVIEITGADVAEKFPVSEKVEPGMVVAIDAEQPGQLCLARGAYNQRVAGVVSGANGLSVGTILGHRPDSADGPPVALSGRVWVYCDATERAIEAGDLLTTAEKPGYAMAVADPARAHGATIGKAMTKLARGETGMVLVLINLH